MEALYRYLHGLQRFIDLNMEGFRKALKKHDKVLAGPDHTARLKERYMPIVEDHCCMKRRQILEVEPLTRILSCTGCCLQVTGAVIKPGPRQLHL